MTERPPTRVLIVDDELLARQLLQRHAARRADLEVIGEACTGEEAVERIGALGPDVVLLDIEMPGLDGFGVLGRLEESDVDIPQVIFVTAFDRYAVRAFEVNAVDYLVKPVTEDRFDAAMDRCRQPATGNAAATVRNLLEDVLHRPPSRLLVRDHKKIVPLPVGEIDWIEADRDYVRVHVGERFHHLDRTITEMERLLAPRGFVRVHRSAVVNLNRIAELKPLGSARYQLTLKQGTRLIVSRSYSEIFRKRIL